MRDYSSHLKNTGVPAHPILRLVMVTILIFVGAHAASADDSTSDDELINRLRNSDSQPPDSAIGSRFGLNYRVGRSWQLKLAPFAGSGSYHFEDSTTVANDPQREDITYGVRVGSVWTLSKNMMLVMELPFRAGEMQDPSAAGQDGASPDKYGSSIHVDAAIGLVYRF